MSQRESGYERKERDLYETPEWATVALIPHLPRKVSCVLEPACGSGKMVRALEKALPPGSPVIGTDIEPGPSFMRADFLFEIRPVKCDAIITNPPYELAQQFIEQALRLTERNQKMVAMLLRTDFDHAKSRSHLFRDCPAFAKKIVLVKRITWFEPAPGEKGKSPSFNHAWFLWDWRHEGPPTIGYGP